jgi:bifunctional non-homologous end joining protein LigD
VASRDPLPDFIEPELALLTKHAPEGDAWLHEVKLDGYWTAARIEHGQVCMLIRGALDWTARFRGVNQYLRTDYR